jgi:hypothetical protein
MMNERAAWIVVAALPDPTKSLARRSANHGIWALLPQKVSPVSRFDISYARLNRECAWKVPTIC